MGPRKFRRSTGTGGPGSRDLEIICTLNSWLLIDSTPCLLSGCQAPKCFPTIDFLTRHSLPNLVHTENRQITRSSNLSDGLKIVFSFRLQTILQKCSIYLLYDLLLTEFISTSSDGYSHHCTNDYCVSLGNMPCILRGLTDKIDCRTQVPLC